MGQLGGTADVRSTLATQDKLTAEEFHLPLSGLGNAFPSLSVPCFLFFFSRRPSLPPSVSLFLSVCVSVCISLLPCLSASVSPFFPHPQFFWSSGWEQQKQPAAGAARGP